MRDREDVGYVNAYPREIPPHTWIKLPQVDLEVLHQSGEVQEALVLQSGEVILGGAHWMVRQAVRGDAG